MRTLEVKVKFVNNLMDWDSLPVTFEMTILDDDKFIKLMENLRQLSLSKLVHEIRWNEQGSQQGHYLFNLFGNSGS